MYFAQIAGKLNKIIRELGLRELGLLEQNLVFGDAGTKDVINFLRMNPVGVVSFMFESLLVLKLFLITPFFTLQDVTRENKLRLLMIYAAVHPEKFEDDKVAKLMEVTTFF